MRRVVISLIMFLLLLMSSLLGQEAGKQKPLTRDIKLQQMTADVAAKLKHHTASVMQKGKVMGAAVFLTSDGYALTSSSVAAGKKELELKFTTGKGAAVTVAKVVAIDRTASIALLKADTDGVMKLTPPPTGSSLELTVGEFLLSVREENFTVGILGSSLRNIRRFDKRLLKRLRLLGLLTDEFEGAKRSYRAVLQHDTELLQKGLIGSALFNLKGELVGVNLVSIFRGVSLATPVEYIKAVMPILKRGNDISAKAYLSLQVRELTADEQRELAVRGGLEIVEVEKGSPAAAAGLLKGDIIVSIDGEPVAEFDDLQEVCREIIPFVSCICEARRGGQTITIELTPGYSKREKYEVEFLLSTQEKREQFHERLKKLQYLSLFSIISSKGTDFRIEAVLNSQFSIEDLSDILEELTGGKVTTDKKKLTVNIA